MLHRGELITGTGVKSGPRVLGHLWCAELVWCILGALWYHGVCWGLRGGGCWLNNLGFRVQSCLGSHNAAREKEAADWPCLGSEQAPETGSRYRMLSSKPSRVWFGSGPRSS